MFNLYQVWEHLTGRIRSPFENCAHGGARADFGMVPYADRINRSDNADPVDVMKLHEGFTTLFLPKTAGGAGNISPSPNTINGRVTPLRFRVIWA
jgi:alpha-galactosidase